MRTYSLLIVFLILVCNLSFADELIIPWDCYPRQLQQDFKDNGLNLDLSDIDRTPESWGFLVNKGSEYKIYTYRPISKEELILVQSILLKRQN